MLRSRGPCCLNASYRRQMPCAAATRSGNQMFRFRSGGFGPGRKQPSQTSRRERRCVRRHRKPTNLDFGRRTIRRRDHGDDLTEHHTVRNRDFQFEMSAANQDDRAGRPRPRPATDIHGVSHEAPADERGRDTRVPSVRIAPGFVVSGETQRIRAGSNPGRPSRPRAQSGRQSDFVPSCPPAVSVSATQRDEIGQILGHRGFAGTVPAG